MINFLDVEQGGVEWLEMRKKLIGASEVPSICGVEGAYKTRRALITEKISGVTEDLSDYVKKLFEDGRNWEIVVREALEKNGGVYRPVVLTNDKYPWAIASLDGWNQDTNVVLEIKYTTTDKILDRVKRGEVPDHFMYQIQTQLMVAESDHAILCVVDKEGNIYQVAVSRIDEIQERINRECSDAFLLMQSSEPLTCEVTITNNDQLIRLGAIKQTIKEAEAVIEQLDAEAKEIAHSLLKSYEATKLSGCGVTITELERQGAVDYKSIPELKGVDLSKYRKPATKYLKIEVKKEKAGIENEQQSTIGN